MGAPLAINNQRGGVEVKWSGGWFIGVCCREEAFNNRAWGWDLNWSGRRDDLMSGRCWELRQRVQVTLPQ